MDASRFILKQLGRPVFNIRRVTFSMIILMMVKMFNLGSRYNKSVYVSFFLYSYKLHVNVTLQVCKFFNLTVNKIKFRYWCATILSTYQTLYCGLIAASRRQHSPHSPILTNIRKHWPSSPIPLHFLILKPFRHKSYKKDQFLL